MLTIHTEDFFLRIEPVSREVEEPGGAYLDWITARIKVDVPGIRAEGQWTVMPGELEQFQEQIQMMYAQIQPGQSAKLASVELGLELTLRMLERGHILGDFCFQPQPPDGACLTGGFGLDQSFLPEILQGIKSLLSFAEAGDAL